jgi:pimeloyl-ACP methyl ester carboxylesterase
MTRLVYLTFLALALMAIQPASGQAPRTAPTTASAKPVMLLVHGAWGGGWAFREVDRLLTADGFKVYRPTLTGQGDRSHLSSPDVDLSNHIQDIVNVIEWENLHDITLVGHSYGGMVITGVADRVPDRIGRLIYLDALLPENGESVNDIRNLSGKNPLNVTEKDGFLIPTWLKPNTPPPHDVPMPAKTFSEKITLKNQDAVKKIPTTFIMTVEPGKPPQDDMFYPFYQRAKQRGWTVEQMSGDHNVQWSRPKALVEYLERANKAMEGKR